MAFCGGGDANQGVTNTAVLINSAAVDMIKAVILMGAPTYVYGSSYDVGTCKAGGVSDFTPSPPPSTPCPWGLKCIITFFLAGSSNTKVCSLTPGPRASYALRRPRSNPTATPRTSIAATATRWPRTRATGPSTDRRPSPLSRASWAAHHHRPQLRPPLLRRRRPARRARRCTASVVGRAGPVRLAARRAHAKWRMLTTPSACRSSRRPGGVVVGVNFSVHYVYILGQIVHRFFLNEGFRASCHHFPIVSAYSLTRASALSSRFRPNLIAVESSILTGHVRMILSVTGSTSSFTYCSLSWPPTFASASSNSCKETEMPGKLIHRICGGNESLGNLSTLNRFSIRVPGPDSTAR